MTNEEQGCMKRSAETGKIFLAIGKAQEVIICPSKNKTAKAKTFSYNYIDLPAILDAIRKPLAENGLSIIQIPIRDNQSIGVETTITHVSGEWISGKLLLHVPDPTAQAAGSAITYARRYAVSAMLGMAADDDDDGASSQQRPAIKQPQALTQPSPQTSPQTTQNRQVSPEVNPNATQSQPTTKVPFVRKCDACSSGINQATLDFSMKVYHAPYCFGCQQEIKKGKETQSLNEGPGN